MTEAPKFDLRSQDPERRSSPFISVWTQPGSTIEQIAASRPTRLFYPLAAAWGASYNLSLGIQNGISAEALSEAEITSTWAIVAINLVFGTVFGIAGLWLVSFFFAWIARLLGGSGRAREVRTVLAWSSVPHIPNLALAVVVLLIGGMTVLTASHPRGTSASGHPLRVLFLLSSSVLQIWGLVISVAGMKVIMGINTLRAIGVFVFGGISITAVTLATIIGFAQLMKG